MTSKVGKQAPYLAGIPVVASTTERDSLFPSPDTGQRVQLPSGDIYYYSGSAWSIITTGGLGSTVLSDYNVKNYGALGDGTTDDTANIRTALTASAGKRLIFPAGTYLVDPATTFSISSGTTLEWLPGATVKLKAAAQIAADSYLFTATLGADNVTLLNPVYDGNRTNQTKRIRFLVGFKAKNLKVLGGRFADSTGAAMVISNCANAQVIGNVVERCGRTGVLATAEQGVSVGCDVAALDPYEAYGCVVERNRFTACGLDGLICSAPGIRVALNTSNGNGVDKTTVGAAGIWLGTSGSNGAHGAFVVGNVCYDNAANGIDAGPANTTLKGVKIMGNFCFLNGTSGIQMDYMQKLEIIANHCYNNYQPSAAGVTLSAKDSQRGGIVIASNNAVTGAIIEKNYCWDDQGGKTQVYGIQIGVTSTSAPSDLVIRDNELTGNLTSAFGSEYPSLPASFTTTGYGSFARNNGHTPTVTALTSSKVPFTSDTITVTLASTANVLGLSTGRVGDVVTLVFGNGNATLKATGGTFVLAGAVDFTPATGDRVTVKFDGTNWQEVTRSTAANVPVTEGVSANRGDANLTLVAADVYEQRFETALTANRTVTLPSAGMRVGQKFRIVRTGLGAFTLDVGGLKTIASATAAFVEVTATSATTCKLSAYGAL
jgi:hypothetical protein